MYLFSAVGLYPAVPGTGELLIHPSRFEAVEMDLGGKKPLRIAAPGASGDFVQYIKDLEFDAKPHSQVWLDWARLLDGGTLRFALSDQPALPWGRSDSALPVSPCGFRSGDAVAHRHADRISRVTYA